MINDNVTDPAQKKVTPWPGRLARALFLGAGIAVALLPTAQGTVTRNEVDQTWELVQQLSERFMVTLRASPHRSLSELLSQPCSELHIDPVSWRAASLRQQSHLLDKDHGLSFNGVYSDSANGDGDEGTAYVELAWDLWAGGKRDYRYDALALRKQAALEEMRHHADNRKLNHYCQTERLHHAELALQSQLLDLHTALLGPAEWLEHRAYLHGHALLEELLEVQSFHQTTLAKIAAIHSNPAADNALLVPGTLPIVDLNIGRIIDAIRQDSSHEDELDLRLELLQAERQKKRRERLKFYLRRELPNGGQEAATVAGVRFSMPLSKKATTLTTADLNHLSQQRDRDSWRRIARTRAAYSEFSEQLERVTKQHYRLLAAAEKLRRTLSRYQQRSDSIDVAIGITQLHTAFRAAEELLLARQTLVARLARVLSESQLSFSQQFLQPVSLPSFDYRGRTGNRLLYVWSDQFNRLSNDTLVDLLHARGIDQVVLSAGSKTDLTKLKAFKAMATTAGIAPAVRVELMVGANSWVYPENHQRAIEEIKLIGTLTDHLHLDIEPHVLDDYRARKQQLESDYVELITRVREETDISSVTIAVPLHWQQTTYAELVSVVDEFYLMAYEQKNARQVIKRLQPILEVVPVERLRLLQTPREFASEWELEQRLLTVAEATGIERFGLHAAKDLLRLAGAEQ